MAAKHPGGVRNKAAFDRAMAQVRKDSGAYKNYQAAMKSAEAKDDNKALGLVENATKKQPKENLFWELKGQLLAQQNKKSDAITAFNRSIQANPEFFRPYVYRGLAQKELGNRSQAEQDLIASQKLLPTQIATYHLGELALAKGQDRKSTR